MKNRVKNTFLIILIAVSSLITTAFSGCTKIEVPTTDNSEETIKIVAEKSSILDTEPIKVTLENAHEPIKWSINKKLQGWYFTPSDATTVMFKPPNVDNNCTLEIIASDKNNNRASIKINIIDEGIPPQPGDILINELAWAGTLKSSYDEYLEIINITNRNFYLNNWKIENAAGNNTSLYFSGYIKANSTFLITNYDPDSGKSSILAKSDFVTPKIALSNNSFGPFILENSEGIVFDIVGDGGNYTYGLNNKDIKASLSRYNRGSTYTTNWNPDSWYTEGTSSNFSDNTLGTPGMINSNISYNNDPGEENAEGLIVKFSIDAKDEIGEDWAQIYITKSGDIKGFVLTDLDGTDSSITNNKTTFLNEGEIIYVIWGDTYNHIDNKYTIPDTNPTGTKDELVLLCKGKFLDGLCYYSTDYVQFDDEEKIKEYGWMGDPINSKYGERKKDLNGNYLIYLNKDSWSINK